MTTPYVDPQSIHNPSPGGVPPAAWGDAVRDGLEYLVRPAGCVVRATSGVTAGNGSWTSVAFNGTDQLDTDAFHGSPNTDLVVPTGLGGWYRFSGAIQFAPNATGIRMARVSVNGGDTERTCSFQAPATALGAYVPISTELLLAAGDVVTIQGFQGSGVSLALSGRVSMRLQHPA